jgi:phage terminase large subunit GpA-like protein
MTRGSSLGDAAPLLKLVPERNERTGKVLARSKRFYNVGVSKLKMSLYRDLMKDDPNARGFVAFPSGLEDDFFQQLTAERRVPIKTHGFTTYRWEKDARQANEMLDCMVIVTATAVRNGVYSLSDRGWDALISRRGIPPAPKPTPTTAPEPSDEKSLRRIREMFAKNPQLLNDERAQALLQKAKAAGYDIKTG